MRLLPREANRLEIFLAAELARRRCARGLKLGAAEAIALISDETLEAARDGLDLAAVERRGYRVLGPEDVLDGVAALVPRIELEPLFADGHRLLVLHDPIRRLGPPPQADPEAPAPWSDHATATVPAVNEGAVPVGITSHFHVFEVNRAVRLDRAAAWGMRLAIAPGEKVVLEPGQTVELRLVPIAGARIVRGHGGLVDGRLDEPGARDAALALARERGYRGA